MNKNVIKGTRKIKFVDKTYKKGDLYLHPLTLVVNRVDKDKITPTETYFDPIWTLVDPIPSLYGLYTDPRRP